MQITEVQIAQAGETKTYAALCPAHLRVDNFLKKLVQDVLFTPHSLRLVELQGTSETVDKAGIASLTITTVR